LYRRNYIPKARPSGLFLGKLDPTSEFFGIPVEVFFLKSEVQGISYGRKSYYLFPPDFKPFPKKSPFNKKFLNESLTAEAYNFFCTFLFRTDELEKLILFDYRSFSVPGHQR
jgi:hypothetical protein